MEPFVAGCYRNFGPAAGESFGGFLLRLAAANGYTGIRDLLHARRLATRQPLERDILSARASLQALSDLGRMAVGDPNALTPYHVQIQADDSIFFRECRIARDALCGRRASVCSLCLADNGWIREEWDFAAVTVCPAHRITLCDVCHVCHEAIAWGRQNPLSCGSCGADFRRQTASPVTGSVLDLAEDFAALAPFRAEVTGGQILSVTWEEMFNVFKALLLPEQSWATSTWDGIDLPEVPLRQRQVAAEALASTQCGRCYRLTRLAPVAAEALIPLSAIPRPGIGEGLAYELLMRPGTMSEEVAAAVTGHRPTADQEAFTEFSGQPPTLASQAEVAGFLKVDLNTVLHLRALHAIPSRKAQEVGYDVDRLLAARKFLQTGLLRLDELEALVGVPLAAEDLVDSGLLPRWNPRNKEDSRVQLDIVVSLQLQLTERWLQGRGTPTGIALGQLALTGTVPFRTVAAAVRLAVGGNIAIVRWNAPFTWIDIEVERSAADLINRRMSA